MFEQNLNYIHGKNIQIFLNTEIFVPTIGTDLRIILIYLNVFVVHLLCSLYMKRNYHAENGLQRKCVIPYFMKLHKTGYRSITSM